MGLAGSVAGALLGIGFQTPAARPAIGSAPGGCEPRASRGTRPAWASEWDSGSRWSSRCSRCSRCAGCRPCRAAPSLRIRANPARSLGDPGTAACWPQARWHSPRHQIGSWRQGAIFAGAVGVALLILWAASWTLIRAIAALAAGGLAVSLAAGPVEPASPAQSDGDAWCSPSASAPSCSARSAGAAQPAPPAAADRRPGAAQPGSLRHPAGSARGGRARAPRSGTAPDSGRRRSCRCESRR